MGGVQRFSNLFQRPDDPQSGVTIDSGGNLYGTTGFGGEYGGGTVYEVYDPDRAGTPQFSVTAGTYTEAAPHETIYFTLNGNEPTTASRRYTDPISISATETVNAIAVASGYSDGPVAHATYTIKFPPAATPVISPKSGSYSPGQMITITDATPGSIIYYTTNGSNPQLHQCDTPQQESP
jgi:hypothetical protein